MIRVELYNHSMKAEWDRFVTNSKQGTFLFLRNYMDYHAQKFTDNSLIIKEDNKIIALFPANRSKETIYSHQGLTYGGLLTNRKTSIKTICNIFQAINNYFKKEGITQVRYKAIPSIYHQVMAEEDLYALHQVCNAKLSIRDISSCIILGNKLPFSESRKSGIRKAKKYNCKVKKSDAYESFWNILSQNLLFKYNTQPVHTLEEINLLKSRFPEQIKLFLCLTENNEPLGGTVIYETSKVIHTQYISASEEGKAIGALDLLFDYIINEYYKDFKGYFDFGKSTTDEGKVLNNSLIFQKEGFGGRGICYDTYTWDII